MENLATGPRFACLILVAACALSCTSQTEGPGEAIIVDLDSKADAVVRLELSNVNLFRLDCNLERCFFQVLLLDASPDEPLYVAAGRLEALQTHREGVLAGALPRTAGVEVHSLTVQEYSTEPYDGPPGTEAEVTLEVERGEHFGMAFVQAPGPTDPVLSARVRLVPDVMGSSPLPQNYDDPWEYRISSVVGDYAHLWTLSVNDVLNIFDPEVDIRLNGDTAHVDMVVYYQCTERGITMEVPQASRTSFQKIINITPDCPTWDDSGTVFIEVTRTDDEEDPDSWRHVDYTLIATIVSS
ncbi:MAG: hypothetical protein JRH11_11495 [Deltaproteobacteria bacterium]|nr:hypothetical protein [Deltaproteobacteria bacterium]